MPPLYDAMDIANALRNEALPALQRFANHSNLRDRDLRRFEDDEPPPYESSTDDTEDEAPCQVPIGELTPVDQDLFDAPLTDQERSDVAYSMYRFHYAMERFREEEEVQRRRINDWASNHHNPDVRRLLSPLGFGEKIQLGERRCAVVARHIVKRRWQKLGVWNPDWGIPEPGWFCYNENGPKVPTRNYSIDRWPWQHNEVPAPDMQSRQKDLVHRAVELRQGLRHGEHAPVPPRSHLTPSSSDAQAESFLTSRPWFQLELEQMERGYRERRLPVRDRQKQKQKHDKDTAQLWKDRGDWQDKWHDSDGHVLVGWKWRHESPSPEPEDLAGVEDMAGLELTPSESCALEGIPDPPPTPPRVFIHDPMVELRGGVLFPTRPMPCSVPEQTVRVPADRPDRPDNDAVDQHPAAEEDRPLQSPPSRTRPRRGVAAKPSAPLAVQGQRQRVTKPSKPPKPPGPARTSAALMPAQPILRRSARIAAMAAKQQPPPPVPPQPRQTKQTRQTRTTRLPVQKKEKASAGVTKRKNPSNRSRRSRQ